MKPSTLSLSCKVLTTLLSVVIVIVAGMTHASAQTYTMGTGAAANGLTITTCAGTFLDPGGAGNYGNNQNFTLTFCSGNGGPITFDFGASFNTQATNDYLEIYDGPTTASRLLYKISGVHSGVNNKVGQLSSSGTCLTFHFVSDGSTTASGWSGNITCTPAETNAYACVGGMAPLFVFKEDFEHGSITPGNYNVGDSLTPGLTGYVYHLPIIDTNNTSYMVNDGEYTLVTDPIYGGSKVVNRVWANFRDHTSGNGYMMLINASYNPDVVYTKNITGLTPLSTYFVTAWVHTASAQISITNCTASNPQFGNIKNANIDFKIYDPSMALVAINSTGNIQPADPDPAGWRQYNTYYQTKVGETSFTFQIANRASGGCGNDFALDDIEVRQCPSNMVLLPVRMASFIAKPVNDRYISLEWLTNSEINSNFFIVQRSKDGDSWEEISRLKGGGNSSILRSYNEVDYNPYDGTSFYRLQQIDMDGKTTWSDTKKVQINIAGSSHFITAGPNPFTNEVKLVVKSAVNEKIIVSLSSLSGSIIRSEERQSSVGLNTFYIGQLSSCPNGVYIVRLQYPNRVEHLKLLKQ